MEPISRAEIVTAVTESTAVVFSTMLGLEIEAGEPYDEPAESASFDGVVALVGVAGSWTGSGRISCSSRVACSVAGALLSMRCEAMDEEVLDAVAEVANMIVGNIKTHFESRLGPLGLSIPSVVFGRNYHTRFSGVSQWTVVPFRCGAEPMEVRFCLIPTPEVAHSARRPAVLAQFVIR